MNLSLDSIERIFFFTDIHRLLTDLNCKMLRTNPAFWKSLSIAYFSGVSYADWLSFWSDFHPLPLVYPWMVCAIDHFLVEDEPSYKSFLVFAHSVPFRSFENLRHLKLYRLRLGERLSSCTISKLECISCFGELKVVLPRCRYLDLKASQFLNWNHILDSIAALRLEFLGVSFCCLSLDFLMKIPQVDQLELFGYEHLTVDEIQLPQAKSIQHLCILKSHTEESLREYLLLFCSYGGSTISP